MLLSCFGILIELVVDTESVSSNSVKSFNFLTSGQVQDLHSFQAQLPFIHVVCYVLAQENQSPACDILIAHGLHHHSIYK